MTSKLALKPICSNKMTYGIYTNPGQLITICNKEENPL